MSLSADSDASGVMMAFVVATESDVMVFGADRGRRKAHGIDRPTCLAADSLQPGRVWCGSDRDGVFVSDDHGDHWRQAGLAGRRIQAIASSPTTPNVVWAGTEPSEVWRSADAGVTWERCRGLEALPSSSTWSFPPRPHTHHVRWIACHPNETGRLWAAIEAGALVSTSDDGATWRDRVAGGPYDTHELAIHRAAPGTLRVAAGDGYFESHDAGETWTRPRDGLEVGYLRSVAIDPGDPEVVIVSASSGPRTAYVAGVSDGRLYRRAGGAKWLRVRSGWPDPPSTIAPLLVAGTSDHEFLAADERGVHRSDDGGASWQMITDFPTSPRHLRGLAITQNRGQSRISWK
ncbi:MAG TPA: hypothetical protein VFZ73_00305 [Gemmatimonadaceae bacterium]